MAKDVFRKMVTAMGLGLKATVWFSNDSVDSGADKLGIFNAGGSLRPSGETFRRVLEMTGSHRYYQNLSAAPLFQHVWIDPEGIASLDALWAEGGEQPVTLNKPQGASLMVVTDYAGSVQTYPVTGPHVDFSVPTDPVFIGWE